MPSGASEMRAALEHPEWLLTESMIDGKSSIGWPGKLNLAIQHSMGVGRGWVKIVC